MVSHALTEGQILDAVSLTRVQAQSDYGDSGVLFGFLYHQLIESVIEQLFNLVPILGPGQAHFDTVPRHGRNLVDRDVLLAQVELDLFDDSFNRTFNGLVGLHFQDQVHAALEVQAQAYGLCRQNLLPPVGH